MTMALAALRLITVLDPRHGLRADRWAVAILLVGCGTGTGYIGYIYDEEPPGVRLAYMVLAAYLTVCSVTDVQTCTVYDILQIPAAAAGAALCFCRPVTEQNGMGLILFGLLQYLVFMRLYGPGDVMAFQICALYLAAAGGDILTMLLHMTAAFTTLGAVQAVRGNINKKGNLKIPVPFLPYIAWGLLWFL